MDRLSMFSLPLAVRSNVANMNATKRLRSEFEALSVLKSAAETYKRCHHRGCGRSGLYVNCTPILWNERHATWQFRFTNSGLINSVKSSGIPTVLLTSRQAPVSDILRMMQSIAAASP